MGEEGGYNGGGGVKRGRRRGGTDGVGEVDVTEEAAEMTGNRLSPATTRLREGDGIGLEGAQWVNGPNA